MLDKYYKKIWKKNMLEFPLNGEIRRGPKFFQKTYARQFASLRGEGVSDKVRTTVRIDIYQVPNVILSPNLFQ